MDFIDMLKKHEGFRSKPYKCSAGKLTIGFGTNLEDRGISEEEAEILLMNDLSRIAERLMELECWDTLNKARRGILMNMAYNLGVDGLLKFKKMFKALDEGFYGSVAQEMLDSKWSSQVGNRAIELAALMLTGGPKE